MISPAKTALLLAWLAVSAAAAETADTVDMELIEFLGSVDARTDSGSEVLSTIDAALLPDLPEEPIHETK